MEVAAVVAVGVVVVDVEDEGIRVAGEEADDVWSAARVLTAVPPPVCVT